MVAKAGEHRIELREPGAGAQEPAAHVKVESESADERPPISEGAAQHLGRIGRERRVRMKEQQQVPVRRFGTGGQLRAAARRGRYEPGSRRQGEFPGSIRAAPIDNNDFGRGQCLADTDQCARQPSDFIKRGDYDGNCLTILIHKRPSCGESRAISAII